MLFSKLFKFDLLVHITFLFGILLCFFFLVGIKEERNSLAHSIQSNTDKMIGNNNNKIEILRKQYSLLDQEQQKELKKQVVENLEKDNLLTPDYNNRFLIIGIIILTCLVGGSVYYGFILNHQKGVKISDLIAIVYNTFILFTIICCIEVLFFFLVILKYQPILNSEINETFIKTYNQGIPTVSFSELRNTNFSV